MNWSLENGTSSKLIDIVGLDEAQQKRDAVNTSDERPALLIPTQDVVRCHLIAGNSNKKEKSLGGNGGKPSNLVPCWKNGTNVQMRGFETLVRREAELAKDGMAIYYRVEPIYRSSPTIPCQISMTVYRQGDDIPLEHQIIENTLPYKTKSNVERTVNLCDPV